MAPRSSGTENAGAIEPTGTTGPRCGKKIIERSNRKAITISLSRQLLWRQRPHFAAIARLGFINFFCRNEEVLEPSLRCGVVLLAAVFVHLRGDVEGEVVVESATGRVRKTTLKATTDSVQPE